jgi:heme-degrading monooxygenase HmoA
MVHIVLFEVQPHPDQFDAYLSHAKSLKPELEKTPGFVQNIRYASHRRKGTILSLSTWKNEKALVKWRTNGKHHGVQEKGRYDIFEDYVLQVGEVVLDSHIIETRNKGVSSWEQNGDTTEVGDAVAVVLVNVTSSNSQSGENDPQDIVKGLGLTIQNQEGFVSWDVFEAVLTPGDLIIMISFKNAKLATTYSDRVLQGKHRVRNVRIIRNYGKYDRREAPQYYPDAEGKETIHAM